MSAWSPFILACQGSELVAVLHEAASATRTGVVIVVGGPQYRVGSHRQFLLLARRLADAGFACLRFDYRGMGDSGGPFAGFEKIGDDIRAAVDALIARAPQVERVVLWGLCDAASAALLYARSDPRVKALVIANPWVRSAQSEARAKVRHYYLKRLVSADFWRKLLTGGVNLRATAGDLKAVRAASAGPDAAGYVERMLEGAEGFAGTMLLLTSGEDLTAAEFLDRVRASKRWQQTLGRKGNRSRHLAEATHTFSSAAWRGVVEAETLDWVRSCNDAS